MNVSGIREISTHINHEDTLVFGTSKYNLPGIIILMGNESYKKSPLCTDL